MSFRITITPSRRAAARFISRVRREVQKALAEERAKSGINQSQIARAIGVHRSVINRELKGHKDITLGRVAELAWALGREPSFALLEPLQALEANERETSAVVGPSSGTATIAVEEYASCDAAA